VLFWHASKAPGFDPHTIQELTNIKDGLVALADHSAGQYEVLFFISSRTGMQVKRPAVGGEGFVLDHMNRGRDGHVSQDGRRPFDAGISDESSARCLSATVWKFMARTGPATFWKSSSGVVVTISNRTCRPWCNELGPETKACVETGA
jgi:hypothetical protein